MKIVSILGARPQFIKAAALSRAILKDNTLEEVIIHTGQHYDTNMSEIFFQQMGIPKPNYNLGVKSNLHGEMTAFMLEGIEKVLLKEQPEMVIVYGDTNSTLAGTLAAKKLHIKVAHVEAGLRSYNMEMPEEINRILTDRISDLLFCPSEAAIKNLHREGFESMPCHIFNVGDIMKDVARHYKNSGVKPAFDVPQQFILATIHRAENTNDPGRLLNILDALNYISNDIPVVVPMHPRTKSCVNKLGFLKNENLHIHEPVGYLEMVYLLNHCSLVVTDSGGVQKEAFYFNKYCVTTRNETEWTELVDKGFNKIAGTDKKHIIDAIKQSLAETSTFDQTLYGTGDTSNQILEILKMALSGLRI